MTLARKKPQMKIIREKGCVKATLPSGTQPHDRLPCTAMYGSKTWFQTSHQWGCASAG